MANILRVIGLVAICIGLALVAVALWPLAMGEKLALLGSYLLSLAATAISGGMVTLGLGQLVAVNQRVADGMDNLLAYISNQDGEAASHAEPAPEAFANVPSYDPRRDPPIVKEGTYRTHTVLTLEDGTVAIETPAGWKRFRTIRDFNRLLPA